MNTKENMNSNTKTNIPDRIRQTCGGFLFCSIDLGITAYIRGNSFSFLSVVNFIPPFGFYIFFRLFLTPDRIFRSYFSAKKSTEGELKWKNKEELN